MKNEYIDNPIHEPQYSSRFLNFCRKVQSAPSAQKIIGGEIPFSIYNSDNCGNKPRIIGLLESTLYSHYTRNITVLETTNRGIVSLEYIGKLIDDFLVTEKDFWLLDYIINAISFDEKCDAYHIFKVMSLIEMLIINPNGNGKTEGELEQKLPQFLSDDIPPKKKFRSAK